MKRYKAQLTNEERLEFQKQISCGVASARKITRARILPKVDEGLTKDMMKLVSEELNTPGVIRIDLDPIPPARRELC